jgi:hypothetical protein
MSEAVEITDELESARQSVATDDYPMSIGEIVNLYKSEELIISPQFQRLFRWSDKQKSDLIESLLIGIPVPPIFVFERADGVWELIDGLQRVSTLLEFFGELKKDGVPSKPSKLIGTAYLPDLEGVSYDEASAARSGASRNLPKALQTQLKRAKLGLQILKASSTEQSKYDVFQRLNGSGSILTAQELRTCLMVMHSPRRHKLMDAAANSPDFLDLISVSEDALGRQEQLDYYCRAVAHTFYEYDTKLDIDEYVTDSISRFLDEDDDKFDDSIAVIDRTAALLRSIDKDVLRRWDGERWRGRVGKVAFEAIFVGVARNLETIENEDDPKGWLLERIQQLWVEGKLDSMTSAGTRGTDRIRKTVPFGDLWFEG